MSRKKNELCKYFQRGSCVFGANCKFIHQQKAEEPSVQQAEHRCNDPKLCKDRILDDLKNERNTSWLLTCYAHWRNLPNDVSGDTSFEELRAAAYEGANSGIPLRELVSREAGLALAKAAEFDALRRNPYRRPTAQTGGFQTSSPFEQTRTIFGKSVSANTVFHPKQQTGTGGFGSGAGPQTSFQPSAFNTSSLVGSFNQSAFPPAVSSSPSSFPPATASSPGPFPVSPFPSVSSSPLNAFASPSPFPSSSPSPFPAAVSPFPSAVSPSASPFPVASSSPNPFPLSSPSPFPPAFSPSPFAPSPFNPSTSVSPFNPVQPSLSFSSPSTASGPATAFTGEVDKIWFLDKWELGQIPEDEPPLAVR